MIKCKRKWRKMRWWPSRSQSVTVNLSVTDSLSVDSLNFEKHFHIFYGAQVLIPVFQRRRMFATNGFVTSACLGQSVTSRVTNRDICSWRSTYLLTHTLVTKCILSRSQIVTKLLFTGISLKLEMNITYSNQRMNSVINLWTESVYGWFCPPLILTNQTLF